MDIALSSIELLLRHPLASRPRRLVPKVREWKTAWHLARLRRSIRRQAPGDLVRCLNYDVRINDNHNFYILYKDIFVNRIYHFDTPRPAPLILDCGSNIGMSLLYFKHVYPGARIVGFEPDPAVFLYLEENVRQNRLSHVRLVPAAVSDRVGPMALYADGKYSSFLSDMSSRAAPKGWATHEVPSIRLRDYLVEPVDFLKMNIEGAEWSVLADSEDRLEYVREMVIEYHHLPGLPRTLHKILDLLHGCGFEYLINDFDTESNCGVRPPFRLAPGTRYFLLIYARRTTRHH
ncbi:MAG: FkbM family methyltransferase [bacterium]